MKLGVEPKYLNNAGYIVHLKNLSYEYVKTRHEFYQSRLSDVNRQNGWGFHYSEEFKNIVKNEFETGLKDGTFKTDI